MPLSNKTNAHALDLAGCAALARRIRRHAICMTARARTSHVGTCLSMADLLAVLYGRTLRVRPQEPGWPGRDRFILSKGHGCAGLYATLAERGFFPQAWLDEFCADGSRLMGHVSHVGVPGVEVSTGSLGHGLPIACGMALALRREKVDARVVTLMSDGECDEGSVWEGALFAAHHGLDNLVVIVDFNKIQSLGRVEDILRLEPLAAKWRAFGWAADEIDGHDVKAIDDVLGAIPAEPGRPTCVVAHTVKGRGVSFMENNVLWHYRAADPDELRLALAEIDRDE
jgi:transketolase